MDGGVGDTSGLVVPPHPVTNICVSVYELLQQHKFLLLFVANLLLFAYV